MTNAYGAILTVACVLLAIRYACVEQASARSKWMVGGIALGSFIIPWQIVAILTQLGISLYVLLYLKAFPPGDQGGVV